MPSASLICIRSGRGLAPASWTAGDAARIIQRAGSRQIEGSGNVAVEQAEAVQVAESQEKLVVHNWTIWVRS